MESLEDNYLVNLVPQKDLGSEGVTSRLLPNSWDHHSTCQVNKVAGGEWKTEELTHINLQVGSFH